MKFSNIYLVQYSISNNEIVPHKANKIVEMTSNKYISNAKFWAPERASKYGLVIHAEATHWGLFNIPATATPKLIISDEIPQPFAKKIWTLSNNYVIMRRANKYMKLYISPFKNVHSLKQSVNKETK